jgi:hypothetical protein
MDGRIILKRILEEEGVTICTALIQLRTGKSGGISNYQLLKDCAPLG